LKKNIFSKVAGLFKTKSYYLVGNTLGRGDNLSRPTNKDYLDSYTVSFLVYACVRKIAEKVANTKFKLYKVKGVAGKEKIDEIKNHPLLDLLAQVNPFTTKFEMLDMSQTYQELLGNTYWYKARGETTGKVKELWQLRPDWVTVVEDETDFIKEYKYRIPNGAVKIFRPQDIIHIKQPNPKSAFYGQPTVKAAMDVIRTSIFATRWNMNFFNNSAIPEALLVTKSKMDDDEKKELRKKWTAQYGGYKNAHKLGILTGEAVTYQQLTTSMRDMEFTKLTETTTQQILTAFGVPKAILGIQGMNRAEADAQIYAFLSETIEPKVRRLVEKLNEYLVPEFGDDLYLDFDDPTPENRKVIVEEYASALTNKWMLINEVRDKEGLLPIDGGWDFYLPMTSVPAGGSSGKTKSVTTSMVKVGTLNEKKYRERKEKEVQEKLRDRVLTGKTKLKAKMKIKEDVIKFFLDRKAKTKVFDEKGKELYAKEHIKRLDSDEKLFKLFVITLFRNQEEKIQDALTSQYTGKANEYEDLVDWTIEIETFKEVSKPVYVDMYMRRGKQAISLVGLDEFDMTKRVQALINKKTIRFAKEINETTKKQLRKTLKTGIGEGEGIGDLSKRIKKLFKSRTSYEATRIARTETLSVAGSADLEAYKQSGVIEKKEWLAVMDGVTRPSHAATNGEVKLLNQSFSNGLMYPGDMNAPVEEIVNCRCALLPKPE